MSSLGGDVFDDRKTSRIAVDCTSMTWGSHRRLDTLFGVGSQKWTHPFAVVVPLWVAENCVFQVIDWLVALCAGTVVGLVPLEEVTLL